MQRLILLFLLLFSYIYSNEPIIILSGMPGTGKGTCSQYLEEKFGYNHISAGDLVRREVTLETELGKEIKEIVSRGDYIDPEIMHGLMRERIIYLAGLDSPFIIDGFVRTKGDLAFLLDLLSELNLYDQTRALFLETPDDLCAKRIMNRLICPNCTHVYNETSAKPKIPLTCDKCIGPLKKRINDTPSVIVKRISESRIYFQEPYDLLKSSIPSCVIDTSIPIEECQSQYSELLSSEDAFGNGIVTAPLSSQQT